MMTSKIYQFFLTWWLTQQAAGLTETSMLDMAPNAFDDQYEGCVEEMEKKAPLLLKEDFAMNEELELEWERAETEWKEINNTIYYPEGFRDSYGIALVAYTGSIYKNFNIATKNFKMKPGNFHYRAFHYYLTRALQLLRNKDCQLVYRGSNTKFYYAGKGSVRFGQFASSSIKKSVALSKPFFNRNGTLFIINTCLGVYIKKFSYYLYEEEVLIPGYEVYDEVKPQNTHGYNQFFLDSPKWRKSNYNCFYSSSGARESCVSLFFVVLPGLLVQLLALAEL